MPKYTSSQNDSLAVELLLAMVFVLTAASASLMAGEAAEEARQPTRPNILLIVVDDLNTALGCYGHTVVKTPHIDRLADRGVLFTRAYSQATVCNASRASIFSGLRPHTIGVLDNETPWPANLENSAYLPDYFQQAGYYTATFGKILDHKRVPNQPFWDLEVREWGKFPDEEQIVKRHALARGSRGSMFWAPLKGPDAVTPDGSVARQAAEMIADRVAGARPFLAAVGFRRPHTPFAVPARYFDLYPRDRLSLPVVPPDYADTLPPGAADNWPFTGDRNHSLSALRAYCACISFVDAQVGVLLATLDNQGLWENTIVIFASDHGYHTGHQGRWHKGWLFEQTCRVPLIVAAPGKKKGICNRIVELIDLFPTLAEMSGATVPAALEGRSFQRLLDDPQRSWPGAALASIGCLDSDKKRSHVGHSLRTADFRYTEWGDGKQGIELYAFSSDPAGVHNLARDPAHAQKIVQLRAQLHSMLKPRFPAAD